MNTGPYLEEPKNLTDLRLKTQKALQAAKQHLGAEEVLNFICPSSSLIFASLELSNTHVYAP